jgi:hypothetical protein
MRSYLNRITDKINLVTAKGHKQTFVVFTAEIFIESPILIY